MAGKPDYYPDEEQFTFNPTKSKELLAEAGYEPGEYGDTGLLRAGRPGRRRLQPGQEGLRGGRLQGPRHPDQDSPFDLYADPDNKVNKEPACGTSTGARTGPRRSPCSPRWSRRAEYSFARFSEQAVDDEIVRIQTLPLDEQPDAARARSMR